MRIQIAQRSRRQFHSENKEKTPFLSSRKKNVFSWCNSQNKSKLQNLKFISFLFITINLHFKAGYHYLITLLHYRLESPCILSAIFYLFVVTLAILHLGLLRISPHHRYILHTSLPSFSSFFPLLLSIL